MSIREMKSPFFDIKDEDGMEFVDIGPGIDYIPVDKRQIALRRSTRRFKSVAEAFRELTDTALSFNYCASPSEEEACKIKKQLADSKYGILCGIRATVSKDEDDVKIVGFDYIPVNSINKNGVAFRFPPGGPSESIIKECDEVDRLYSEADSAIKEWSEDDQEVIDNMSKALEEVDDGQKEMPCR